MQRFFVLLLLLLCTAAPAAGQTVRDDRVSIPRVMVAPQLDDYLSGGPRPDAAAITTFVQREPGDGVPASQRTEAYLSYDNENLYVVFLAHEQDPSQVRASLTRREGFGNDDYVGIMLDTFLDRRRAYLFMVNPLGVQLDGVNAGGNDDDYSYDTVWSSEGRLTPFGYAVRMAIPFKSLRFSNAPEQEWGIALARGIRRNNETSFWPYITARVASALQQMGVAGGLRDISPGRNVQFIPYGAFTGARFLDEERPAFVRDATGRAGVDGKLVVKDAFTLDLTFNPDFSQVESDEPQVTINQRFEVFFPEKRPFFIENASYFDTPINLFFSRRVADPQAGARLTGKAGGWAIAALAIDDRAPGERLPEGDPHHEDRAGIGVVRLQRELPRESSIALMTTARRFGGRDSYVAAVDGRYRLSSTWVASAQAAFSTTPADAGADLSGPALIAELDRTGRNWGAFIRYEDISPEFRAPLGFVPRVDMRRFFPFVRYTWFPERAGLVSIRPEVSGEMLWDHAGTLQDWESSAEVQFELKGQTEIEVGVDESMERFDGTEFRKDGFSISAETAWLKWLEASVAFDRGTEINFFPSADLRPFLADGTEAEVSLTFKPIPPLRIDQTYLFTRLRSRPGVSGAEPGARIVDNHILRARTSYQFTRRLSLRAIVDYSAVLPDTQLIDLERDKQFTTDLLVTYMVNPWTALYAGYTDGYANLALDPREPGGVRRTDSAFNSLGRQVFVKVSYLLRF